MSTDDSVSEDVSSSGPLSHCHVSADGGKESEASLVSSEGTSASGLAVSEDRHAAPQTTGGTVESRPTDITPACNKIRSLCLSTDEAFEQGKSLPFINPSSLETLRALVQEIQSSGETDPEIWKDCEGRWLHLFQLVEKQYQEQILAQQEQYQCQIQLIQDEIKALVQLQNRQPHTDVIKAGGGDAKHYIFPLLSADCAVPRNVASDSDSLAAPALSPFSSPSPPLMRPNPGEERATTVLSSGYGTLSAWETGPEAAESPGDEEEQRGDKRWFPDLQEDAEMRTQGLVSGRSPEAEERVLSASRASQPLTSWAQRQKLRVRKSKGGQVPPLMLEHLEPPPPQSTGAELQHGAGGPSSGSLPLRRSDSLMSEASGLTYWRLNEQDLYHPLPDSFDSSAFLLPQEASSSPSPEPRLSLREIYHNKQRADCRRPDWEGPQMSTLEPTANTRQSDRTSGFTSPSHFSSPSLGGQQPAPNGGGVSESPDSAAEGGLNPGDTDCISDTSSLSAVGPATANARTPDARSSWANRPDRIRQRQGSEEEGSHTHTSTLKQGSSLDDPVVLSLLRQNLRDKHSRHVADLKAYYESEIQTLRDKLKLRDLPQDLERSNQALTERCRHLEEALAEATSHVQELEAANISLEKKLAEWPERYAVAGAAVKSLQQRLEENKRSAKEKEAAAARLKARVHQLEEAVQRAGREADERESCREREYKMLQDLLGEYDALAKQHEGVKNNLVSTEDKLVAANDQISELKRIISKLESQVKQLEHENQARLRHTSHGTTQPSGAGLFHHPDLLLSPSQPELGVARRKSPCQGVEPLHGSKKPSFRKRAPRAPSEQSSGTGSSVDAPSTGGSWRCVSPPECEQAPPRHLEQSAGRREGSCAMTPMMRALIELEETRATQSRAPWVGGQRTTVGFVEQRHKEPIQERAGLQDSRDRAGGGGGAVGGGGPEAGGGAVRSLLRPQRSLSPDGLRSSSLPPTAHRSVPVTTPTLAPPPAKRETLLAPLSAKSSPKRCPTENFSTAFGHMMPREEHLHRRFDGQLDQRRHSFHSGSPRKRLHFVSAEPERDELQAEPPGAPGGGDSLLGWEEPRAAPSEDSQPLLTDKLHSLAEAEKLLDELTQEKLQVEAALSRLPGSGGRVSIQTRLDEVALEKRLERLNRELGSLRMTLKRFHVLRSSANI